MTKAGTAHGGMAILAMSSHGQDARGPSFQHGPDARATSFQHGQDARATSFQHGQDARGPSFQHGQDARATSRETVGCELAAEVIRSFGKLRLRANGSSMIPAVWPGDILSVHTQDAHEAQPGDIVLFGRDGRLFAHRVVEVRSQEPADRSQESGVRSQKSGFRIWNLGFRARKNPQIANRESQIADGESLAPNPEPRTPALPKITNRQSPITNSESRGRSPESRMPSPEARIFVTRGDSLDRNDPPISFHELLGRVTAIERGSRRFTPHQSMASRLASWILSRSDFATSVVLKLRDVARAT